MNEETRSKWKLRIKRILKYGLIAVCVVAALIVIAFASIQTQFAKQRIAALGSHFASQASGYQVQLTGLRGVVPFDIHLDDVLIEDEEGILLRITHLAVLPDLAPILRGLISIKEIRAESILCERLPESAEEEDDDAPLEIPAPPDFLDDLPNITIQRIVVDRIELASPVLGIAQAYSLEGSLLAVNGGGMDASLQLTSLLDADVRLALEASIGDRPAVIRLSTELHDPQGALATLAGLEDLGGFELRLDGEGSLADWRGELSTRAEKYGGVDSRIRLAWGEGIALAIDGEVEIAPLVLDATAAHFIGDAVSFDVEVGWMQANLIAIERVEANFKTASLGAQGEYFLDQNEVEGRLALSVPELSVFQPFVEMRLAGGANVVLDATGALLQPRVAASIRLTDVRIDQVESDRIHADLRFTPDAEWNGEGLIPNGNMQVVGFAEPFILAATTPIRIERIDWNAAIDALDGDSLLIERLHVESPVASLHGRGEASPLIPSASMQFEGSVANLSEWRSFIAEEGMDDLDVLRGLRFHGNVIADVSASTASSSISAEVDVAPGLDEPLAQLVGSLIELTAELAWDGDDVRISSTQVNAERLQLAAQGAYGLETQSLNADWSADLRDVAPLEAVLERPISGALFAEGTVTGALDSIVAEARIHSDNLSINDVMLDEFRIRLQASESSGVIAGDVDGLIDRNNMRLEYSAEYQLSEERFRLAQLKASGPGLDVEGDADFNFASGLLAGDFRGASSDLSRLGELVNEPLQGEFDFTAHFDPADGRQNADVSFRAENIESQFGQLQNAQAEASLSDLFGDASARIQAELTALRYDEFALETLRAEASGDQGNFAWMIEAMGEAVQPFALAAAGGVVLHGTQTYRVDSLEAEYAEIPVRLSAPAFFETSESRMRLEEFSLHVGEGALNGLGWMTDDGVEFDLHARRLPAAWLEHAGVANATGFFESDIEIRGTPLQPLVRASLRSERLRYQDIRLAELPDADLLLEAEYGAQNLELSLRVFEEMGQPFYAQARLPLELSLQPFHFDLPQEEPIQGRVTGELDLSILPTLLYLEGQSLGGLLMADVEIGGRLAQPTIVGGVELNDGRYDHLDFGVVLRDITLKVEADSLDRLVIQTLSMTDGGRGTIQGQGFVSMDPENPLEAALTINNAALLRMDEITATLTGQLSAMGTEDGIALTGNLTAAPINVRIPGGLPQGVQSVAFTEIGETTEVVEEEPASAEVPFGDQVQLDLTIRIPNRMFVRGRGMDTEWQGNLNIRGFLSDPLISGNISIVRGTFQFFNNMLRFESGTVQFSGASPPDPFLNIVAGTTKRNTEIQLRIAGPVSSPNLGLTSNPAMSSDEILSFLLFGRHLTEITPLQAIQLANAANTLRGGGGGGAFDLMGQTRDLLGVDQIQFRMGEGGGFDDARIGIGKYLTDEIYVDFEQGYGNKSSAMNVEVRITPNIYLESELGMDKGSGFGVLWKYDF